MLRWEGGAGVRASRHIQVKRKLVNGDDADNDDEDDDGDDDDDDGDDDDGKYCWIGQTRWEIQ